MVTHASETKESSNSLHITLSLDQNRIPTILTQLSLITTMEIASSQHTRITASSPGHIIGVKMTESELQIWREMMVIIES